jgi:hypothetical protein
MSAELWHCPSCGRTVANRNQSHTCAPLGDLDGHVVGKEPAGSPSRTTSALQRHLYP